MRTYFLAAVVFVVNFPIFAHHSDAGIDVDTVTAFEGTVTAYEWQNPHVYLMVETVDEQGEVIEWEVQMGAVSVSIRRGWSRDTLSPGDQVLVRVHGARDGRHYGILESLDKKGGLKLSTEFETPDGTAVATSIAGKWIADHSSFPDYPGGYDGLFRALLKLNDKARQAATEFDPFSRDNPDANCIGRPTPGALVSTSLYLMEFEIDEDEDIILIRSERYAEERTVFMDGRIHPPESESFETGHSIGWWEGDTLMVDTRNFNYHRSPYQLGVPSSKQKHVIEKYRLNDAGTHLETEFVLEDPEYLTVPTTHARNLIYSPEMEMFMDDCDGATSRRFQGKP